MSWKKGRPEGWKNPYLRDEDNPYLGIELEGDDKDDAYEAGADAMHKADLEFLGQFPDLILTIKATMTKEEWLAFVG